MFNTARNFWKMIDDRNVTAIVMLCHENEHNQVSSKTIEHFIEVFVMIIAGSLLSVLAFNTKWNDIGRIQYYTIE